MGGSTTAQWAVLLPMYSAVLLRKHGNRSADGSGLQQTLHSDDVGVKELCNPAGSMRCPMAICKPLRQPMYERRRVDSCLVADDGGHTTQPVHELQALCCS